MFLNLQRCFTLHGNTMKFVSPLLKRIVYPCLSGAGCFRSAKRSGLAVVTYHGVLSQRYDPIDPGLDGSLVTADTFRQQLRLLKSNYNVISPEEMLSWCSNEAELPPRAILLTCDDGLLNNLTEMLPILQEEGLRCLFFVTGASGGEAPTMLWYEDLLLLLLRAPAGKFQLSAGDLEITGILDSRKNRHALWWSMVERLSKIDAEGREHFLCKAHAFFGIRRSLEHYESIYPHFRRRFGLLMLAELKQLAAAGMSIGAHTLSHPVLSQQPPELAWAEIVESRALLESITGKKVWAFAYPFGDSSSVSAQVIAMVKEAGFAAAFVNIGGGLGVDLPLQFIPRVHVNADMGLAEFEAHVSGFYEVLQRTLGRTAKNRLALDFSSSHAHHIRDSVPKQKTA